MYLEPMTQPTFESKRSDESRVRVWDHTNQAQQITRQRKVPAPTDVAQRACNRLDHTLSQSPSRGSPTELCGWPDVGVYGEQHRCWQHEGDNDGFVGNSEGLERTVSVSR